MIDRKATLADVIRAINSQQDEMARLAKKIDSLENMMADLNNAVVDILSMSGATIETVKLDS